MATIILFGSYARGQQKKDSDIDLCILLDNESISLQEKKNIKYPLYEIEFENSIVISPLILSKKEWETKQYITPFYYNVVNEGITL